ncbi:hypothetical protein KP509_37G014700 [Ceratopteris richardii]|uniref:Uncharacterized protein n=1 Tax=Ceratopteris richardii TaxID=49495 RepID=A0A8T2Q5U2_CERRI|nr:hypothetical protein KP509_37G014700 [Ceratopteris richardii]
MDRLRDTGRRGILSAGGTFVSSLRRPRPSGGSKDPTDEEELMEEARSFRLRDRPRKEGNIDTAARHKRTRHTSRDLPSRINNPEEGFAVQVHESDEDDMPISTSLAPRKPVKSKLHGKVAADEVNAVGIPTVPRKARTAVSKRHQEFGNGDGPRHQVFASAPLSSTAPHSSLGPSLKPTKCLKHNGSKFRSPKQPKVSGPITISQQEVEVAEALFDLSRMVSSLGGPQGTDEKLKLKTEYCEFRGTVSSPEGTPVCPQDSVSTPPTSHSAVSSPVHGPLTVTSSHLSSTEGSTKKLTVLREKTEEGCLSESKGDANGVVSESKNVVESCTGQSIGSNTVAEVLVNVSDTSGQMSQPTADLSSSVLPMPSQSSMVTDTNALVDEPKSLLSLKMPVDNIMGSDDGLKSETSLLTVSSEQALQHVIEHIPCDASETLPPDRITVQSFKYEIDLMASPNASDSGDGGKVDNSADSDLVSRQKFQDDQVYNSSHSNHKRATECEMDTSPVREENITAREDDEDVAELPQAEKEHMNSMMEEIQYTKQLGVLKQEVSDLNDNNKANSSACCLGSGSGWQGTLPPNGYYSAAAVAAAWPTVGSFMAPALKKENASHPGNLMSGINIPEAQPPWKRCASHVYIAHFIDTQQQNLQQPAWAPSGRKYSMKSCNPNSPNLPPDFLFGGGLSVVTGLAVNSFSSANKSSNSDYGPQSENVTASIIQETSLAVSSDRCVQKYASDSSRTSRDNQNSFFQAGHESILGSLNGHINSSQKGSSMPAASRPETSRTCIMTPCNASSRNAAAIQVHHLQAVIQQAGVPLSSPGHLTSPIQRNLSQQGTPLTCSFHNLPLAQLPPDPMTGKVVSKPSSLQGESPNIQHYVQVNQSLSERFRQQKQQVTTALSSQSKLKTSSHQLEQFGEVPMNLVEETASSAESKFPVNQVKNSNHEVHSSNNITPLFLQSSSMTGMGMHAVPIQSVLTTKQGSSMTSAHPGQLKQQPFNPSSCHYPLGISGTDLLSEQGSTGNHMGSSSLSMVGTGPSGLASVASVMASQGHVNSQYMGDAQLSQMHAYQEGLNKYTSSLTHLSVKDLSYHNMKDDGKLSAKPCGSAKMDKDSEKSVHGSLGYMSGPMTTAVQQSALDSSFNFVLSSAGSFCSKQGVPSAVGLYPSFNTGRTSPNLKVNMSEPTIGVIGSSSNLSFHASSGNLKEGAKYVQAVSQRTSPSKPASHIQSGVSCFSVTSSSPLSGSHASIPAAKQQNYPSKGNQTYVSPLQSRFTVSSSSTGSISSSSPLSKANFISTVVNTSVSKDPFNSAQKQNSPGIPMKTDAVFTHLPGQVVSPTSIGVSLGQSQIHHYQSEQQHMHIMKQQYQQQHQWLVQPKQLCMDQSEQLSVSLHQQIKGAGVMPSATVQYHQAVGANHVQFGINKQLLSSQPITQPPYLDNQMYHPQRLSQANELQQNAQTYPQAQQLSSTHHNISSTIRSVQQAPEIQCHRQQGASVNQQQLPFTSVGALSSATSHMAASFSMPNSPSGRSLSSDGNVRQVSSPKAFSCMKPPVGTGVTVGTSSQRDSNLNSGISRIQGLGVKVLDASFQQHTSSGNTCYVPYLHSAAVSGTEVPAAKNLGVSAIHTPNSAPTVSMRDGLGENGVLNHLDKGRSSCASKITSVGSQSMHFAAVKSSVEPIISCASAPPASHSLAPALSNQNRAMISATLTDSNSTT